MTERIILSIVAITMLILTIQKGDKWTIILTSGLTLGIMMTWIGIPKVMLSGMAIYMLTALLISFYSLKSRKVLQFKNVSTAITGIWAFGANLFQIMNWPYADELRISMFIPIILFLILLTKGLAKSKDLGYMSILNTEFILRLIR